ncbi:MAG: tRNA (adenosine(37)-N6)-dimethylallyltransferase MiaA [Patescibacteria group bacterium]
MRYTLHVTPRKLIVVVGPTAVGKSDLAVTLAKMFNGEVISADSRQVYRGMDIGSGKVTRRERKGIPHQLLDVADPRRTFTVTRYRTLATRALRDAWRRGRLPILCGGTGFYIQALVDGTVIPEVKPNRPLRRRLERETSDELYERLQRLDRERAKAIDRKNPRRLVRAIEIAHALGRVPPKAAHPLAADTLWIGVRREPEELKKLIRARLVRRLRRGMVAEIKRLRRPPTGGGVSWSRLENFGLEYRWIARFLQRKVTRTEMLETLTRDIYRYAKRQMTWFKPNPRIHWIKKTAEAVRLAGAFVRDAEKGR